MSQSAAGHVSPLLYVELQQLYAAQSHAIDCGRPEDWARTFTEDGVFNSPTYDRPIVGRPALAAFAGDVYTGLGNTIQHHYPSNLVAREVVEGSVEAQCYVLMVQTPPGENARILRSVRLIDDLVSTNEGWRIRNRNVFTPAPTAI